MSEFGHGERIGLPPHRRIFLAPVDDGFRASGDRFGIPRGRFSLGDSHIPDVLLLVCSLPGLLVRAGFIPRAFTPRAHRSRR